MKRLLLVLLAGLCAGRSIAAGLDERQQKILGVDRPSSPAYAHAALPTWDASASGPLRPTNSVPAGGGSGALGDLVVTCENFTSTCYGYTLGPLDGTYRFTVPFETADMGWTGYVLEGTAPPANMDDIAAIEPVICDPNTGGNLVMLWSEGLHEQLSIKDLYTDHPSVDRYFGEYSGTISFSRVSPGPPEIDIETVDPLLPSSRNWYRSWLIATNPPAPPVGPIVVDTLVLPVGISSPIRDQPGALVEVLVAEPPMLRALVQRYRSGLAPTNIPVNLSHDPSRVVGSVANLWWVEGEGVWARLLVSDAATASRLHSSCEILGLRAQATDAWGTWGDFWLPWQIRGVGLVERPALATPVVYPSAVPASPYPGVVRP